MSPRHIELHARSAFSFLRGASEPEAMFARAAELGLEALAITDHGGFQGSARAHAAARAHGLRAFVGLTLRLPGLGETPLLCPSRAAYAAACRYVSDATHFPDQPPPPATLAGCIALSGDREGPLLPHLLRGDREAALRAARELVRHFGPDHVFIELHRHQLRDDARLERLLVDLASHLRLPLLASNAPLYARRRDRLLADAFTALRHHRTLARAGPLLAPNGERHLKSAAEMAERFADRPEALANSLRLAERLEFTLRDLGYRFPDWHDAGGQPLSPPEQSTLLRRLTFAGAATRHGQGRVPAATRRQLRHELELIHRLGFSGYFLVVRDLVAFARGRGILCQGRGSAANSAVCHALGITHVDPVESGLLFERFLSENRRSWPDIDIDFPSGPRREEVIQYVYRKYAPRGAAMTANVITCQPRSAFREMAKVLDLPPALADRFSRTRVLPWNQGRAEGDPAPPPPAGPLATLHHLYHAVLGLPRHLGQHSGGMIVSARRLDAIVPLQPAAMPGRSIVQWDKDDCEDLGIVKVDLLGLGMLAAMEHTLEICRQRGRAVDLAAIPKDDPAVFELLGRADTIGTFQVESRAQMATLPVMRPQTFYDVAIQVAIIRPGPIVGDLVHPYLNRRNGHEPVDFIHPSLEPVLRRTLGVPLFQEQVLRMAMALADFSGAEADELRRAMGSKRSSERMRRMEETLRQRMDARGIAAEAQEKVIRSIGSFALYGFPESHAISFALIAYASCWLKAHRPAEFYCGLINHQPMGFYSVHTLLQDARRHGLRVRPVSCLESEWETGVEPGGGPPALRLGLHRLKGLSEACGKRIVARRREAPFRSLEDFRERVRPSARELRVLAAAGALNGLPAVRHRREALWQAELPLHHDELLAAPPAAESACPLPAMDPAQRLAADLSTQGASTGPHPLALWRRHAPPPLARLPRAADLQHLPHGRHLRVAGLVICRQRPSTANGHCFISLEDETGIANLFIPKPTFERFRLLISTRPYLLAHGRLQLAEGGLPTLFTSRLEALPHAEPHHAPASHDFH